MKIAFKVLFITFSIITLLIIFGYFYIKSKHKNSGPPPVPTALKLHSSRFNNQLDTLVIEYLAIKDAFVEADTLTAKKNTSNFLAYLSRIDTTEIKVKDTANVFQLFVSNMENLKANGNSLLNQTDITEMRRDFKGLSEAIFPFLKSANYSGKTLYVENCPMAFGEGNDASWISNTSKILNPYLGKNHPEYKSSMLQCGEVVDSITGAVK